MIKLLACAVCSVLFMDSMPSVLSEKNDGWVSVERPDRFVEDVPEGEGDVWVVFVKEMEGEKFLVRFPEDPTCRCLADKMMLEASREGEFFRLCVRKKNVEERGGPLLEQRIDEIGELQGAFVVKKKQSDETVFDLLYWSGEKWAWERSVETSGYIYTFHTESDRLAGDVHRMFIHSFDVRPS